MQENKSGCFFLNTVYVQRQSPGIKVTPTAQRRISRPDILYVHKTTMAAAAEINNYRKARSSDRPTSTGAIFVRRRNTPGKVQTEWHIPARGRR